MSRGIVQPPPAHTIISRTYQIPNSTASRNRLIPDGRIGNQTPRRKRESTTSQQAVEAGNKRHYSAEAAEN